MPMETSAMSTVAQAYAELEIGLHRQGESWQVELRFNNPSSEAEIPAARGVAPFDLEHLIGLQLDPRAYGEALATALFHTPEIHTLYQQVRAAVETANLHSRIRLLVGPSAPELQSLRWELLRLPESGGGKSSAPCATSERILFSRFMVSHDWRPVNLRPRTELRALVAIAAPAGLERYKLAAVDRDGELARAHRSLQGITLETLGQDEVPCTLGRLVSSLRDGVDILYLVCHGHLKRSTGEPFLFLQDDEGAVARVPGHALAERISELARPPRLVVLASCESAGTEDGIDGSGRITAHASLAPRLAEAGVSAVLAMQGKISMETVEKAMPIFFEELLVDGQIDRAMAVARGAVRDREDSWMPALYLRLKGGRLWYQPGFAGEDDVFAKWKSIVGGIRQGSFVPILGPDLNAESCGSESELAEILAKTHGFPMAPHQGTDLAKVTQYLSIHESRQFVRDGVLEGIREQILKHHPDLDTDSAEAKTLFHMFRSVAQKKAADKADPLRILADLGGSVYVNASGDPLLPLVLGEAGKTPELLFCNWRKTKDNHPQEPPYEGIPSAERPIVHCPFGYLAKGDSLVLTEDDYVDYLIAAADYKLIPRVVRGTLVKSSLLFLGFSLDSWAFRVLFRQIMALEGSAQLGDFAHVGVQIDPSENNLGDVERARTYLEKYFGTGRGTPCIDVYWGSAGDFLRDLQTQLEAIAHEPSPALIEDDEDDWMSFSAAN